VLRRLAHLELFYTSLLCIPTVKPDYVLANYLKTTTLTASMATRRFSVTGPPIETLIEQLKKAGMSKTFFRRKLTASGVKAVYSCTDRIITTSRAAHPFPHIKEEKLVYFNSITLTGDNRMAPFVSICEAWQERNEGWVDRTYPEPKSKPCYNGVTD